MPAPRRVTDAQILKLLEYLEHRRDIKLGTATPVDKQIEYEHWVKLTEILNKLPGETRDVAKWRSYWNDLKWRCRRKLADGSKLVPYEHRILDLAGKVSNYPVAVSVIPRESEKSEPEPNYSAHVKVDRGSDDENMEWNMDSANLSGNQVQNYTTKDPLPVYFIPNRDEEQAEEEKGEEASSSEEVPEWVRKLEQRRLALEERSTQAMEQMCSGITSMTAAMHAIATCLRSIDESLKDIKNKNEPEILEESD